MTLPAIAAIAAVGTGQRPSLPPVGGLAAYLPAVGDDPQSSAYALLDAAAALAVVRNGTLPVTRVGEVPRAPSDTRPEIPDQLVALLAPLVADGAGLVRVHSDRVAVLIEAFALIDAAGLRLPHKVLPTALARRDLRAAVQPVLGERGDWLLGRLRAAGLAGDDTSPEVGDAESWLYGTSDQRLAWFGQTRRIDPQAAQVAAEAIWRESPAAFRADLVRVVVETVDPRDEDFLERCLDDRADSVRAQAREGLARLPESAYVSRMRARAAAAVAVDIDDGSRLAGLLRRPVRLLTLTPPEADETAARDGIGPKLSAAERLNALVEAVPPADWPSLCGLTVARLATMPQTGPAYTITSAVVSAVVRNRDTAAAADLAAAGVVHPSLVPLLPAAVVARLLHDLPSGQVGALVETLPLPWPDEVVGQVGRHLVGPTSHLLGAETWSLFARAVPVRLAGGWATRLRHLGEPDSRAVRTMIRTTTSVLTVRALIGDTLRPFLPESVWQGIHSGTATT